MTGLITPSVPDEMGVILSVSLHSDICGLQITAVVGSAKVQTQSYLQRWIGEAGVPHAALSAGKWISAKFTAEPSG